MKLLVEVIVFVFLLWSSDSTAKRPARINPWCLKAPGLTSSQRKLCLRVPGLQTAIKKGIEKGLQECEREFQWNRWNCSLLDRKNLVRRAPDGTKEAAFTTALLSAAIALSIAKACTSKDVTECSCEGAKRPFHGQSLKWRGCSVNIRYGTYSAERFMLSGRGNNSEINTIMKQNVRVGLEVLKENRLVKCTVGTSGRIKSCQLILPPLQKISRIIKAKYYKATRVIATKRDRKKSYYLRTVGSSRNHGRPKSKKPKKSSLVYFSQSPSYCYRQDQYSIPGTRGRQCQRNTLKEDDCTFMCCGRGYKREAKFQKRFCHCKASADEPCSCKICTDVIIENKCL